MNVHLVNLSQKSQELCRVQGLTLPRFTRQYLSLASWAHMRLFHRTQAFLGSPPVSVIGISWDRLIVQERLELGGKRPTSAHPARDRYDPVN